MTLDPLEPAPARHRPLQHYLPILAIGWAARVLYLLLQPASAVSIDATHWHEVAYLLMAGRNPYVETGYLNWPPVWPGCIWLIAQASVAFGVSFGSALFVALLAAESLAIVALLRVFEAFGRSGRLPVLIGVSLNPAMIFQVAQHGSFDMLMGAWVLLALERFVRFRATGRDADWYCGCAWLGLGVLTKTVPLALLPIAAMAGRPMTLAKAAIGATLAIAPTLTALLLLYASAPDAILSKVIAYRSFGGWYGIPGFLRIQDPTQGSIAAYARWFAYVLAGWQVAGFLALGRGSRVDTRSIILASGLVMSAIPTFGSGYGSQYIWWYWPALLLAYVIYPNEAWRAMLCVAGLTVALTYVVEYTTFLSHGGWLAPDRVEWLARPDVQTLIRLPQFIVSVMTFFAGLAMLWHERSTHSAMAADRSLE